MTVEAADGTQIGWYDSGNGRPVLLVHGGVSDANRWMLVRPFLIDGLRVVSVDRRGRGLSGSAEGMAHSIDVEADDVVAVAEQLGGDVVVVGHSIGATISAVAMTRAAHLFSGGVLYEPPLPSVPSWKPNERAMLAAIDEQRFHEALTAFLRDLVGLTPDEINAFQASAAWDRSVDLVWTMRREAAALNTMDADLRRFASIEVPVELLVGDRTAHHHIEAADALLGAIPQSHRTVLYGQGHGALMTAPQLIADAINKTLAKIPARS